MERKTSDVDGIDVEQDIENWDGIRSCVEMRYEPRYMLRVDEDNADEIAARLKESRFTFHFCSQNRLRDSVYDIEFSNR